MHNFCLAACALGLGTCWTGTMNREKVKGILDIPTEKNLLTVLPVGYPSEKGKAERKEVYVFSESWTFGLGNSWTL